MAKIIRLSESDLHEMVNESVKDLIKEGFWGDVAQGIGNAFFPERMQQLKTMKSAYDAYKNRGNQPTDNESQITQDAVRGNGRIANMMRAYFQGLKNSGNPEYLNLLKQSGLDVSSAQLRMQLATLSQQYRQAEKMGNQVQMRQLSDAITKLNPRYWKQLAIDMSHHFERQYPDNVNKQEQAYMNWLKQTINNILATPNPTKEEVDFFKELLQQAQTNQKNQQAQTALGKCEQDFQNILQQNANNYVAILQAISTEYQEANRQGERQQMTYWYKKYQEVEKEKQEFEQQQQYMQNAQNGQNNNNQQQTP